MNFPLNLFNFWKIEILTRSIHLIPLNLSPSNLFLPFCYPNKEYFIPLNFSIFFCFIFFHPYTPLTLRRRLILWRIRTASRRLPQTSRQCIQIRNIMCKIRNKQSSWMASIYSLLRIQSQERTHKTVNKNQSN